MTCFDYWKFYKKKCSLYIKQICIKMKEFKKYGQKMLVKDAKVMWDAKSRKKI